MRGQPFLSSFGEILGGVTGWAQGMCVWPRVRAPYDEMKTGRLQVASRVPRKPGESILEKMR